MSKTKFIKVAVPELKPKDIIVNYLDEQIQKHMEFECMPENENGYYFVSRSNIGKMVDGLIPLVKSTFKNKSINKQVPDREEEMRDMLEECLKSFNWISENCTLPTVNNEDDAEDSIHYLGYRKQELQKLLNK